MAYSDGIEEATLPDGSVATRAIGNVVTLLCQVRLMVLILAVVVSFSQSDQAIYILFAGAVAIPFSYVPARSWNVRGAVISRSGILLAADLIVTTIVIGTIQGSEVMVLYGAATVALFGVIVGVRLAVIMALPVALIMLVTSSPAGESHDWPVSIVGILLILSMAWAGSALGHSLRAQALITQELENSRERRGALMERIRIARDLHDSVAGTLAGLSLLSGSLGRELRRSGASDSARRFSDQLEEGCRSAHQETRVVLGELRRIDQDPVDMFETICETWSNRTQINLDHHVGSRVRELESDLADDLRAILLELLENIRRHADALNVQVLIAFENGILRLRVRDDGAGFRTGTNRWQRDGVGSSNTRGVTSGGTSHFGLLGIEERIADRGGQMAISSAGTGATIDISVAILITEGSSR